MKKQKRSTNQKGRIKKVSKRVGDRNVEAAMSTRSLRRTNQNEGESTSIQSEERSDIPGKEKIDLTRRRRQRSVKAKNRSKGNGGDPSMGESEDHVGRKQPIRGGGETLARI